MSLKRTIIFVIILVLLAGFLYKLKWQEGKQRVERIFIIDPQEVEEIRLARKGWTIILEKQGNEWKVIPAKKTGSVNPLHDGTIIRSLLSVFDYGIIDIIDENPRDLAEFGLDNPEFEFRIKTKGNPSFKTLLIGNDNPIQNSCYAKVEVSPRILLLGILYKTDLDSIFDRLQANTNAKSKLAGHRPSDKKNRIR